MARGRSAAGRPTGARTLTIALFAVLLAAGPGASALGTVRSMRARARPHRLADLVGTVVDGSLPRVVRQRGPRDCGPAALATVLAWRGRPVGEDAVLRLAHLRADGVSLAELARLAAALELPGAWYAVPRRRIPALPRPFIAHLGGDGHYLAVAWVGRGFVLVADPARGLELQRVTRFAHAWSGRVLLFDAVLAEAAEASPASASVGGAPPAAGGTDPRRVRPSAGGRAASGGEGAP